MLVDGPDGPAVAEPPRFELVDLGHEPCASWTVPQQLYRSHGPADAPTWSMRRLAMSAVSSLVGLAAGLAAPGAAIGHTQLDAPIRRYDDMKAGPCGKAGGVRTANVCTFQPGATITVQWDETV